jgi:predicted secreted protein
MKHLFRIWLCAAALLLGTAMAMAADAADRAIIGFSGDGRYFAFEEFGIYDGSGAPYSNIYIIDLEDNVWVEGSPIRVGRGEGDDRSIYEARREALTLAAPLIDRYGTIEPGRLLASNAVGEEVSDPHTMVFKAHHNLPELWTIKLTHLDIDVPPHCQSLPVVKAFALSVAIEGKEPQEFYRDKTLPESRGCPESYRLGDVIAPAQGSKGKAVVLVHKLTFGFEGRDARFLAIPVALPGAR